MEQIGHAVIVGVGATAVMDLWGLLRHPLLGMPRLDYALLGRWVGHMPVGRFRHPAIAASPPVQGEWLLGLVIHYLIGTGFAAVLLAIQGPSWLDRPTLAPALIVGIGTVAAPLLIMQPAMAAALTASRQRAARLQSVLTHTIYGFGLYLAGWADHLLFRLYFIF